MDQNYIRFLLWACCSTKMIKIDIKPFVNRRVDIMVFITNFLWCQTFGNGLKLETTFKFQIGKQIFYVWKQKINNASQ